MDGEEGAKCRARIRDPGEWYSGVDLGAVVIKSFIYLFAGLGGMCNYYFRIDDAVPEHDPINSPIVWRVPNDRSAMVQISSLYRTLSSLSDPELFGCICICGVNFAFRVSW